MGWTRTMHHQFVAIVWTCGRPGWLELTSHQIDHIRARVAIREPKGTDLAQNEGPEADERPYYDSTRSDTVNLLMYLLLSLPSQK